MIRSTVPGSTLRRRTYYSTYKGRTRKGIRPLRNESQTAEATISTTTTNDVVVAESTLPITFSIWWNTNYMPMIENGNEIIQKLKPETITLYDKINTFINTLNETIMTYYHVSFQIFSPENEFNGNSFIYIGTNVALYKLPIVFIVMQTTTTINISNFEKIASYPALSSDTWATISKKPQLTGFIQPLQIENGFQKIFQYMNNFEALFLINKDN